MRAWFCCCLALLWAALGGCLSIDRTPLEDQSFFQDSRAWLSSPARAPIQVPQELRAGAARVEITPPAGVPLAGYGKRLGQGATGVHDRLYTKALALSNGQQQVILVTSDLLAITHEITEAVYKGITREIPLVPEALMVTASHNHSGPGALARKFWEGFAAGRYDPELFDRITDAMVRAAVQAYRRMAPAGISGGFLPVPEHIRNRMVPGGPVDPALSFLKIRPRQGSPITLVNYSAHATVLPAANDQFSGDYPGALQRWLESRTGGMVLFTAGAVGDQAPRPPAGQDFFERSEKMGRQLAHAVLGAPPGAPQQTIVPIIAAHRKIPLPPTQLRIEPGHRLPFFLGDFLFDRWTVIQVIRIGQTLLVGVPCDLSSEAGLAIKQYARQRNLNAVIVGFANDYIGYVIPEKYYDTDAYEARLSFNGPYMGSYLKQVVFRLVDQVSPES